ncbi:sulfotransferase family protein [Flagellimonas eckloniae]|uniref:Sulfotransferase domain-containing protein n=1 Tax=Flagellimonas eckloniae TaxID=346185 RepID=A0A0Q0XNI2_9FLAO|nr:sulfotransferase [Allomuricauda eckloniae]KQC30601.1 hypothetical protein AAY42_12495 [Allomuricauda eckloniae]
MNLDFLLIGAQKCATTWIYHCLNEHPELFVGGGKNETYYFRGEIFNQKGLDWFESLFADASVNQKLGSASVDYIWDVTSIEQARRQYPDIKIIVALRNPVERTISAFFWLMRKKIIETISLDDGIRKAIDDYRSGSETIYSELIRRSLYTDAIIQLHENFEKDQIRLVLFDDIQNTPKTTLRSIYSFLNVSPDYVPTSLKRKPKGNSYSSTLVYLERKMPINKFTTKALNGISEVIKISSKTKSPKLDSKLTKELLEIYRQPFNTLYDWLEQNGSIENKEIKKAKNSWKL